MTTTDRIAMYHYSVHRESELTVRSERRLHDTFVPIQQATIDLCTVYDIESASYSCSVRERQYSLLFDQVILATKILGDKGTDQLSELSQTIESRQARIQELKTTVAQLAAQILAQETLIAQGGHSVELQQRLLGMMQDELRSRKDELATVREDCAAAQALAQRLREDRRCFAGPLIPNLLDRAVTDAAVSLAECAKIDQSINTAVADKYKQGAADMRLTCQFRRLNYGSALAQYEAEHREVEAEEDRNAKIDAELVA